MPILNSAYFTAWYDDMTSAFGKVCRIKNRYTFKSMPILNSAYFTECRFVIRHITQTDTETETEANFTHLNWYKQVNLTYLNPFIFMRFSGKIGHPVHSQLLVARIIFK